MTVCLTDCFRPNVLDSKQSSSILFSLQISRWKVHGLGPWKVITIYQIHSVPVEYRSIIQQSKDHIHTTYRGVCYTNRDLLIYFLSYLPYFRLLDKTSFLSSLLLFYLPCARAYCACTPTNHPPTPPLLSSHLLCLNLLLILDTQPSLHYPSEYRLFVSNIWHILFSLAICPFIISIPTLIFFFPHIHTE